MSQLPHVWPGQVWSDQPQHSAVIRTFIIQSVHGKQNVQSSVSLQDARYAYCEPVTAARVGVDPTLLEPFFADLRDFPPHGSEYSLVEFNPAWPSLHKGQVTTPIGTFHSEGEHFFWSDHEGNSYVSGPKGKGLRLWHADANASNGYWSDVASPDSFQADDLRGFMQQVHYFVFAMPDKIAG